MKVLRIASVYNEADIIGRNLEWYIKEGIEGVIIDEGSQDGTYEICEKYIGNGLLELVRQPSREHDREYSVHRLWQVTKRHSPDVIVLADADEFFESPDLSVGLYDGIKQEFDRGYNVIQQHNIEFWMTEKDDPNESDPLKRIRYYSYFSSHLYRIFAYYPEINVWSKLGHAPVFPPTVQSQLSHKVFISRHYKFRSLKQGYAKIDRIRPPKRSSDRSIHYLKYQKDPRYFIIPSSRLTKYTGNKKWNLKRTFDGWRMNRCELIEYLGLSSEADLENWFASRTFEF